MLNFIDEVSYGMTEMIRLNLIRMHRRHFLLVVLGIALGLVGLMLTITTQQINQANEKIILKLDKQSEFLAQELQNVPAKPVKINEEQADYWSLVKLKEQLLVDLVQAKKAKQTKNEINFRHYHRKILIEAQGMNKISSNEADKYLQLNKQSIKQLLKRDNFLEKSGQTIMIDNYSLSTAGFLTLLLTVIVNPIVLALLMLVLNWTWREDFDSGTGRLLLLGTGNRHYILYANLLVNMVLFGILLLITGILGAIVCQLYNSPEQITWQYPLAKNLSLTRQAGQLILAAIPIAILVTLINNLITIFVKQLNLRIALNMIGVLAMTLIPQLHVTYNPLWQVCKQLYLPEVIPIKAFLGAVFGVFIMLVALRLVLNNYSIKRQR